VNINSPNFDPSIRWLWRAACLPVLLVLVILEPLVTFLLATLALLGLLTTLFFYLVGPPQFRVWTMLALSLGFAIALVPYHALIDCCRHVIRYTSDSPTSGSSDSRTAASVSQGESR
jgi:hypothetical protein